MGGILYRKLRSAATPRLEYGGRNRLKLLCRRGQNQAVGADKWSGLDGGKRTNALVAKWKYVRGGGRLVRSES
jgi:hypothetical protein